MCQSRQEVNEHAGKHSGKQHAHGRQHDAGLKYGFYVLELCIHAAGKQYYAQGYHSYELRIPGTVELQSQSVAAEKHAYKQEQQQSGYAETVSGLAYYDT